MCPDVCSFCFNRHEGECVVPCLLNVCVYCYGANDQCTCLRIFGPCNRCLVWHLASCCERHSFEDRRYLDGSFSSCSICGIWHGSDDCVQKRYLDSLYAGDTISPCNRCNTWHGADVCAQRAALVSVDRPIRNSRLLRNRAVANVGSLLLHATLAPAHSDAASDRHNVGSMSTSCTHCGARFWPGERIECCFAGSLVITEPIIPQSLSDLILKSNVRQHLRSYNMAMAMASVGHSKSGFPDGVFAMSGKSYHRVGSLVPRDDQATSFAQIYTLDTSMATDRRSQLFGNRLDPAVLRDLHDLLKVHNRYVSEFCHAAASEVHELLWSSEDDIMGMQMGALVCSTGKQRPIVIKRRDDESCPYAHELQMISDGHSLYHTLAYPLLFPTGAPGWYHGMSRVDRDGVTRRSVTLHDYGRYMLMHRERLSHIQQCRNLALEFYCDMWAQNEARAASFHSLPSQQAKYRMGRKCAVEDQIHSAGRLADVSVPMLLPSSFIGSAKWYHMLYLDALTLPQRFHSPDLFITFTCNPKWPEIQDELPRGHSHLDHPDIVARVFYLKFKAMMEDIVDRQIFGAVQGFVWRIEWQARGLPHVHLLIILVTAIRTARQVDAVVSAEVPDPAMFPELYCIINEFQLHAPCDHDPTAGCRDNPKNQCKRRFPKAMSRETVLLGNRYPLYRRRGRFCCEVKGRLLTDDWVVPFSPFLSLKYRAHINVEIASSIKSFKYVYKYVLKPPDSAVISINEIQAFLSGRLLSAAEAVWRLLGLPLHKEFPSIVRLHIHLPNAHTIVFDPTADPNDLHDAAQSSTSTLLQWFDLNHSDTFARSLLYSQIPEYYVWNNEMWLRRKTKQRSLGRIFAVSSRNQELFALRRLLSVVRGATGWDDLRIVDGHCYESFQAACGARGMLADDGDIIDAFNETAQTCCSLDQLRQQFATLLLNRQCQNVPQFFEMMWVHLCRDSVVNPRNCAEALWSIEDVFASFGRSLTEADFGMILPQRPSHMCLRLTMFMERHMFDRSESESRRAAILATFTNEQDQALAAVMAAVDGNSPTNIFTILASAGCGKTMWVEGLTWSLRALGLIIINVAASALAATLLPGGSTAHSAFRIPIPTTSSSFCGIKSAERELIRQCKVICYDEVSMVGKEVAECLNRLLQDVMQCSEPFGGKVVVFLGDFKQLLPVEPGRKYPATVKDCSWWPQTNVLRFTKNFRAAVHPEFCALLEVIGNGSLEQVPIPASTRADSVADLISKVYGDNILAVSSSRHLIMAFTLEMCNEINVACLAAIPGDEFCAVAHDDTKDNRQPDLYTDDYLSTLPLHGVPPSSLPMKVGARYMIIKNYNPAVGACNGTLCELLQFTRNIAHVKIQTGIHAGRVILLPRCSCHVSRENSGLPFDFTRVQFPLIPAYAVSVHKSQGQSLCRIGIIVDRDSFAHGQVYTALSRTSGWDNITVLMPCDDTFIVNKVYRHVLE
jgi:hypothetical protein